MTTLFLHLKSILCELFTIQETKNKTKKTGYKWNLSSFFINMRQEQTTQDRLGSLCYRQTVV